MAQAHGIGCQICTSNRGKAAQGFSRISSRVAATVSGIRRGNGKDFGESDRSGQNLGEKRDHCGVSPEADKGRTSLPRVVDPISKVTIHRRFPACLPRDREFGLTPFNARLMNDNARRALLSVGTYFFANAVRHKAEKRSTCGLSGSDTVIALRPSEVSRALRSSSTSPWSSVPSRSAFCRPP